MDILHIYWFLLTSVGLIQLKANGQKIFDNGRISTETSFTNSEIRITISGLYREDMAKFSLLKDQIYLGLSEDISLILTDTTFDIKSITLENNSKGKINVSQADMDMYLNAFATENMNNFFNRSYTPKAQRDINETEINAEFAFPKKLQLIFKK